MRDPHRPSRPLRILLVSDLHYTLPQLDWVVRAAPRFDLVVLAGDHFDISSAVGKRGYTDRLVATIRRLGDSVEQDHYVKLLADKVGVGEEASDGRGI